MAAENIISNYFGLEWLNTIVSAYNKNGNARVGRYFRSATNLYVSEVLLGCNVAAIPKYSQVNSVTISFDVATTNLIGAPDQTINVVEQDNGAWVDNGSTEPVYNAPDPPFDTSHTWPAVLSSSGGINNSSSGTLVIPSSPALVALVQDFVNEVKDAEDGLLLTMEASYFDWYLTINNISIDVDYSPPPSSPILKGVTMQTDPTRTVLRGVTMQTEPQTVVFRGMTMQTEIKSGYAQKITRNTTI